MNKRFREWYRENWGGPSFSLQGAFEAGQEARRAEVERLTAERDKYKAMLGSTAVLEVLVLKGENANRWRDRDDSYWLARLMQEVGELGSSLVGDHDDPPEHELRQIASIALNWLEKRTV